MSDPSFRETLAGICQRDARYPPDAYHFLCEALQFTTQTLKKPTEGEGRHVSGLELLEGMRNYALQQFGPMSRTVLRAWGIQCTEDVGNMVFNMVQDGLFGKTDDDRYEDFAAGYDFEEAFAEPFRPRARQSHADPADGEHG